MAFIRETGNPGIQAAAAGMAAGLERTRQIQDQQAARMMALQEMELRQKQFTAGLDQFAIQSEQRNEEVNLRREELGLKRKLQEDVYDLNRRQFDYLTEQDRNKLEVDTERGKSMAFLAGLDDGMPLTKDKEALVADFAQHLGPEAQVTLYTQLAKWKQERTRIDAERRSRYVDSVAQSLVGVDRNMELQVAELMSNAALSGNMELYQDGILSLHKKHLDKVKLQAATAERLRYDRSDLATSSKLRHMSEEDRFAAQEVMTQIEAWNQLDPADPQIKQGQEQLRVLMMDSETRKERQQHLKELETLRSTRDVVLGSLPPAARAGYSAFVREMQERTEDSYGKPIAEQFLALDMRATNTMLRMGIQVDPTNPTPFAVAPPILRKFAFDRILRNLPTIEGMSSQAQQEKYVRWALQNSGIDIGPQNSPGALALKAYLGGDESVIGGETTNADLVKYAEATVPAKKDAKAEYDAILAEIEELRVLNVDRAKKGLAPVRPAPGTAERLRAAWEVAARADGSTLTPVNGNDPMSETGAGAGPWF